jgi:putative two-component system response regulator
MTLGSVETAHVVVVDDEEPIIRLVLRALAQGGYQNVTGTTHPAEVIDILESGGADLIVTDIRMPGIDGYAILRSLAAARSEDSYLPVLAMSALGDIESKRIAMSLGAKDFLVKPFSMDELLLRVRSLLETRLLNVTLSKHRDKLDELVSERTAELEQSYAEMLERLSRLAELRDDATSLHTVRVAEISRSIAEELDLPEGETRMIAQAAPLHDLGKVAMHDAILLKPSALAEDERATMERHASIGAAVLKDGRTQLIRMAESVARHHHERWDGSGYPEGLAGEQIPLAARIVSVADAFDAMVNERPYSAARAVPDALEELRIHAGSQFDREVVCALLRAVRRGRIAVSENARG